VSGRRGGRRVPYLFDLRPFRVCYAYKHLVGDFASEAAFREAHYAAVPKTKYFEFVCPDRSARNAQGG
jgi:hypothetical protein